MDRFAPMKAVAAPDDLRKLRYPMMMSEKIDGIRCLIADIDWAIANINFQIKHEHYLDAQYAIALSASGKPIPNHSIQRQLDHPDFVGFDGELTAANKFNDTSSAIMSHKGEPAFTYSVFDIFNDHRPYAKRAYAAQLRVRPKLLTSSNNTIITIPQHRVESPDEVQRQFDEILAEGGEGIVLRDPAAPYKYGRSTLRQGWMLKIKAYADSEARVVGYEELFRNANELTENELGASRRSSHQENKFPTGKLGALVVEQNGIRFKIGTGFSDEDRRILWATRLKLPGRFVKLKSMPPLKDAPRCPVFLGFRSLEDMTRY